ncbi:monofunctional biosynthetic peptidoglycan transglycosylase [Hydrogenophaga sp. BPS33]|uniref:monofunctional biosynthetic peptidoglycan transglycosylase n=1 Tax=Hydrogenophaga sp. BPS33 TaxID=2651974 RepID=UPI00131F6E35|nr:monofunctional biosynthetic peptidoglycan transglycosylase [Hydrogenophaga sp. BPS33]QHE87821.1 monofunctional biosynthetic peptidoglycan transglycosylase [Hydrogenophaga sp. BPS33]
MKSLGRWLLWLILAGLALQLFFVARIAVMVAIDPVSTTFMRSEAWRIAGASLAGDKRWRWSHEWVDGAQISPHLKRAVIASEDAGFNDHAGVEWEAIEGAWQKNERRQQQAEKRAASQPNRPVREPKIVGGSTITQQLAKNLLLSGERQFLRKGQELMLTVALELLLDKRRILEIYLNSVEWGEGIFGAEAAAQRYFNKPASKLNAHEAARLAVMLPSPKFFETRQGSAYLARRTGTIVARMGGVQLP